jgi:hypothetical protein
MDDGIGTNGGGICDKETTDGGHMLKGHVVKRKWANANRGKMVKRHVAEGK